MKRLKYFIVSIIFISCVTQKPLINEIPEIDNLSAIYFSKNELTLNINGELVYNLTSFGSTSADSNKGTEIEGAKSELDYLFNYPFGRFDYSYALEPSLSRSSKYLAKANDDFALFNMSFNPNVDIDILDLSNVNNNFSYKITLPSLEYKDEKYQIPWSENDEAFFGIQNDSLFKTNPSMQSKELLITERIFIISVSPHQKNK